MSLLMHVTGQLVGEPLSIEAPGSTPLGVIKREISSAIKIAVEDFDLVHGGEVMGDMNMLVSGTALCEGDEIVIEPSKRFVAGERLREMGVGATMSDLKHKVLESDVIAATDEEKAGVVELMVECNPELVRARGDGGMVANTWTLGAGTGQTALNVACAYGNAAVVRVLLDHGADVHCKTARGASALHRVASSVSPLENKTAVAKLLLSHGLDVDTTDDFGRTALHESVYNGCAGFVRFLLEQGANVRHTDSKCESALDWAAHLSVNDEVCCLLRQHYHAAAGPCSPIP